MRNTNKTWLRALCLLAGLSLVVVEGGAALAESTADPSTTDTTTSEAPTTTEAPPTTEAPSTTEAPPTTEAPTTTEATAPSSDDSTAEPEASEPHRGGERWGPDPRWTNYGNCGGGVTACHVAKAHQRRGFRQWRQGRWFVWGNDLVRGHRGESWRAFQIEARQIRRYLFALYVARVRRNLVNKWSGVARCESGGNWSIATGNGYYGGLQFNLGTWGAYGGRGYPHHQPAWYQASVAERVRTRSGLHHWPHCGRYFG